MQKDKENGNSRFQALATQFKARRMWLALDDLDRFLNQLDPNMLVANLEGVVSQHQCRAHANHVDDIQRSEIEMQFIITQALYKMRKDEQVLQKIALFLSFCQQTAGLTPFKIKYLILKCKIVLRQAALARDDTSATLNCREVLDDALS